MFLYNNNGNKYHYDVYVIFLYTTRTRTKIEVNLYLYVIKIYLVFCLIFLRKTRTRKTYFYRIRTIKYNCLFFIHFSLFIHLFIFLLFTSKLILLIIRLSLRNTLDNVIWRSIINLNHISQKIILIINIPRWKMQTLFISLFREIMI